MVGQGFIRLMQMLVVPLVFCSLVCGSMAIGDTKTLGKVGVKTIGFYLVTTALAVSIALGTAYLINPGIGLDMDAVQTSEVTTAEATKLTDTLLNIIPKNPINSMANGDMLPIIVFALFVGIMLAKLGSKASVVANFLKEKFAKKPAIAEANIKVIQAGYDYGHNTHSSATNVYRIETKNKVPGRYMDITGNKATAYGFIAAAEKAGLKLYLGSYPITPATDVLHELSKHKSLGVTTVQCEDEIAGCASAVGAAFGGALAVTSTSGPGLCLKSEAINLAVIMELPLVVLDVQRGGPATGLPTKSEQTDLLQALFGRNGESPLPVIAATSPTDCFYAAYEASKMALEHMTPVILLTDAYIANGSGAFKLPDLNAMVSINPPYVPEEMRGTWTPYMRAENGTRYWAVPGREGFEHILGGLEKDDKTGAISTNPENHDLMTHKRQQKIDNIEVPELEVIGDVDDAELLIVGFGSTYGHLRASMDEMRSKGMKVAQAHFKYINPLPKNTAEVLRRYPKVVVAEQNMGQLAAWLRMKVDGFTPVQFNQVKGQPFIVNELVEAW